MLKLLGLRIQNFGILKNIKIGKLPGDNMGTELKETIIISGLHGSGKSTLLDVFRFIYDCINFDVDTACYANNRGGYDQLVSQGVDGDICLDLYCKDSGTAKSLLYELVLSRREDSDDAYVKLEQVCQYEDIDTDANPTCLMKFSEGKAHLIESDGKENMVEMLSDQKLAITVFGQFTKYTELRLLLEYIENWFIGNLKIDCMKQSQTLSLIQFNLNLIGSNINSIAYNIYLNDLRRYKNIIKDLQVKVPYIENIIPVEMQYGQVILEFWQKGFNKPIYVNRISDSTLKLFAYYLLLNEKNQRQLVFIDEPDSGLCQMLVGKIALLKKNENDKRQFFITTCNLDYLKNYKIDNSINLIVESDGFAAIKNI